MILKEQDIEKDKYMAALMIPMLEYSFEPINIMYENQLRIELELFKQRINYSKLDRHIDGIFDNENKTLKR